jgi:phage tail protein X
LVFSSSIRTLSATYSSGYGNVIRFNSLSILVNIQEDQAARTAQADTDDALARIYDLLVRFGNEKAKAHHGLAGAGDEEPEGNSQSDMDM